MRKSTKKLTVSAILCALCVIIMLAGSVIEVMDLSVAAICSFAVLFAVIELGSFYPVLLWLSASTLGILLLPVKFPALYFALFFGWYPIVKAYTERLSRLPCILIKLAACCVSVTVICAAGTLVAPEEALVALTPLLYPLACAVFILYDIAMSRMRAAYLRTWKKKLGISI